MTCPSALRRSNNNKHHARTRIIIAIIRVVIGLFVGRATYNAAAPLLPPLLVGGTTVVRHTLAAPATFAAEYDDDNDAQFRTRCKFSQTWSFYDRKHATHYTMLLSRARPRE